MFQKDRPGTADGFLHGLFLAVTSGSSHHPECSLVAHVEAFESHSGADCCFCAPRTRLQRTVEQVTASVRQGDIPYAQWSSLSSPTSHGSHSGYES